MSEYSDEQLVDLLLGIKISRDIEEAVRREPELRRRCASLRDDLGAIEDGLPGVLSDGVCDVLPRSSWRILLAIDGSHSRHAAALAALNLAKLSNSVVEVLHVREVSVGRLGLVTLESRNHLDRILGPVVAELRSSEVMARAQLRTASEGRVAEEILSEACEIAADLIVIGASHRSLLRGLWAPRVGAKVVRCASCPVLVAHSVTGR